MAANKEKAASSAIEITLFTKSGGPLTKRISLTADGLLKSDGSECFMARGTAQRVGIISAKEFAKLIGGLDSDQAIALGTLRPELPNSVKIITKKEDLKLGGAKHDVVARTGDHIIYRAEHQAFALFDFDTKGMPPEVAAKLDELGGFWEALVSVLPALGGVARVVRHSTSSGLSRSDTGDPLPGSKNLHVFIVVKNGTDIERFLRALHVRCWLAGLGWMMIGGAGQVLERSIVDRMVGGAERLVFEGAPILKKPIVQDQKARRPVAFAGDAIDTITACPPLTIVEIAKYEQLQTQEEHRLRPEASKARAAYVETKATELVKRKPRMTMPEARIIFRRQCEDGVLLPDIVLPFDDKALAGCTVGDVLADPERFEGATLADPNEGVEYGRCKAKIFRRQDGTPWINSFAHGRTVYPLKFDAAAIRAAMKGVPKKNIVATFCALAVNADTDAAEMDGLIEHVAKLAGAGKMAVKRTLKSAQDKQAKAHAEDERKRRAAACSDPRPVIARPADDAPWLPQMQIINDVLSKAPDVTRDADRSITRALEFVVPNTHALTSEGVNDHDEQGTEDNE